MRWEKICRLSKNYCSSKITLIFRPDVHGPWVVDNPCGHCTTWSSVHWNWTSTINNNCFRTHPISYKRNTIVSALTAHKIGSLIYSHLNICTGKKQQIHTGWHEMVVISWNAAFVTGFNQSPVIARRRGIVNFNGGGVNNFRFLFFYGVVTPPPVISLPNASV